MTRVSELLVNTSNPLAPVETERCVRDSRDSNKAKRPDDMANSPALGCPPLQGRGLPKQFNLFKHYHLVRSRQPDQPNPVPKIQNIFVTQDVVSTTNLDTSRFGLFNAEA